jgi:hypothetical protein
MSKWQFREASRNVHVFDVNLSKVGDEQWFLLQSDVHWDNPHCDRKKLKKHLDLAMQRNAPVLDFGDFFCAMQGKYDKRSSKNDIRPEHQNGNYLDSLVNTAHDYLKTYAKLITLRGNGNHECVDPETEVLTRNGFIPIAQVTKDMDVAQIHPANGEVIFAKPLRTHEYDYSGEMVKIERRGLDMLLTPNHRVAYHSQHSHQLKWMYASELGGQGQALIIPTGGLEHIEKEYDLSDDKIKLAAWAITDGSFIDGTLHIYQSKPKMVERIRDLLSGLGLKFSENIRNRNITHIRGVELKKKPLPQYDFRISKEDWVNLNIGVETKDCLPNWVWLLSERQYDIFMEELILGDGSRHKSQITSMMLYGKKQLLDSVQATAICRGYRAMLSSRKRKGQDSYWCLNIVKRAKTTLRTSEIKRVPYEGKVYCLTTPSGNFIARRNGKVFATGNSAINKNHETDLNERLAERLRASGSPARRGGYSGYVRIQVSDKYRQHGSIVLWYFHGSGGGGPVTRGVIQTNRQAVYVSDADIVCTGHVHESWQVAVERIKLNHKNKVEIKRQSHVKIAGYKEEYGDGYGGWHIETGKPPKPTGAWWLRLYIPEYDKLKRSGPEYELFEAR